MKNKFPIVDFRVPGQFGKEASQTRPSFACALRAGSEKRASPRFPWQARDRLLAAQKTLAQDDINWKLAIENF